MHDDLEQVERWELRRYRRPTVPVPDEKLSLLFEYVFYLNGENMPPQEKDMQLRGGPMPVRVRAGRGGAPIPDDDPRVADLRVADVRFDPAGLFEAELGANG